MDDAETFIDIASAVLARVDADAAGWSTEVMAFWCCLRPPAARLPDQGWKLHVTATQLSAPLVLARVTEAMVAAGATFKFARGRRQLAKLLSNQVQRGSGGKFITVYPEGEHRFRELAAVLDRVTDGLTGPRILSDRQLRPGSSVYYRYGVISSPPVLSNDGTFESMLTDPAGRPVPDERAPAFRPPPWVTLPLPGPEPTAVTGGAAPAAVLIGDRFVVRDAIRHSYRGGVFRATDRVTGEEVVVKQARAHVMSSLTGTDAGDLLRHEAKVLDLLGPVGLAPRKVALVGHQENLYLAEERVAGTTLRDWVAERVLRDWHGTGAPVTEAVDQARQLVDLVAAVHAHDLVLRDLKPANLMVTPQGRLRLIDLEGAVPAGSRALPLATPGYAAPELATGPYPAPAPARTADLFSLGASILYLSSGIDPALPPDRPVRRTFEQRLDPLVARAAAGMPALRRLAPLVRGLTREDPAERWSLDRAREFLATGGSLVVSDGVPGRSIDDVDRLLSDGLAWLVAAMTPEERWLWRPSQQGKVMDPCTVQHGAAGVLGVLNRSARVLGGERLLDAVATAARWIDERMFDVPRVLPGLYFGRSGTAWALYDAAVLIGDAKMADRAIELAEQAPVCWPNPDVCHGVAGAGMTALHLGTPERATDAGDQLLRAAGERTGRTVWPVPQSFESKLAGQANYGFGHGVAGIGAFLLSAGSMCGREEFLHAARRAGDVLADVVDYAGPAAYWRTGVDSDATQRRHWCHGSSGVGTFLIRLWAATGEARYRELAEAAAVAVYQGRWYAGNAACHGLAGDGEFLLDLADLTGEQCYRDQAWELAATMAARHAVRDGLAVLADSPDADVIADYGTGLAGGLGFLLRLRYGGSRSWMPDDGPQRR